MQNEKKISHSLLNKRVVLNLTRDFVGEDGKLKPKYKWAKKLADRKGLKVGLCKAVFKLSNGVEAAVVTLATGERITVETKYLSEVAQ